MSEELKPFDVCNTDARYWAKEFMRILQTKTHTKDGLDAIAGINWIDEGLMICWFANAIESGRMAELNTRPSRKVDVEKITALFPVALPKYKCRTIAQSIAEAFEKGELC